MKTKSVQPTSPPECNPHPILSARSAAIVLNNEIATLGEWLAAQGLDVQGDTAHADDGSRDRLYWRYGYFIGLKHAQALLTSQGATLH